MVYPRFYRLRDRPSGRPGFRLVTLALDVLRGDLTDIDSHIGGRLHPMRPRGRPIAVFRRRWGVLGFRQLSLATVFIEVRSLSGMH